MDRPITGSMGTVRGNSVVWDGARWVWSAGSDAGFPAEHWDTDGTYYPCTVCGVIPTPCEQGCQRRHDPCLGHIEGIASACCGHGVEIGYVLWPGQRITNGWYGNVSLDLGGDR